MNNHLSNSNVPIHPNEEKKYLCEYTHENATWSIEIDASSFEDAEKRLKALSRGQVLGEVKAKIVLPKLLGKIMRWIGWGETQR